MLYSSPAIITNMAFMQKSDEISKTIRLCDYCGEIITSGEYCSNCKTQAGRKKIFDANAEICKENQEKGFNVPAVLKNWK